MKTYFKILVVLSLFSNNALAQKDKNKETHSTVIVNSIFDPALKDAYKINYKANIVDSGIQTPNFNYNVEPIYYQTHYEPMLISPAKVSGEPLTRLYRNLLKVGMGNYTTPYLELFSSTTRSRDKLFGLHFKTISSFGKIKDYAYPGYSDLDLSVFGKKCYNKFTIQSVIEYNRDVYHYYGYKINDFPNINLSNNDIKKTTNYAGINTKLFSNNAEKGDFKQFYNLKYYYFVDSHKNQENFVNFESKLSKNVRWIKYTDYQNAGLNFSFNYINNKWDSIIQNDFALLKLNPYISTRFKEYEIKLGINAAFKNETKKGLDALIFPNLEARLNIVPSVVAIYAGYTGDIDRKTIKNTTFENPFLSNIFELSFETYKNKIYAGIESSLSKKINLNLYGFSTKIENAMFFVSDTNNILKNKFTTVIDDSDLIHLKADIIYTQNDKLWILLSTKYYNYNTNKELEAWHKPTLEIDFIANYNIENKFIIQAEASVCNGIYAKDYDQDRNVIKKSLPTIYDFSLGLEYRYNKNLGAFLNLNNIANKRNFKLLNYPSQKFNFMLGISYSFGGNIPTVSKKREQ